MTIKRKNWLIRSVLALVCFLLFALFSTLAFAQTTPVHEAAGLRFINTLLDIFAAAAIPLVAWFAHRLIAAFEKKTGVHVDAGTITMVDDWLQRGIDYAHEQAHKFAKKYEKKMEMSQKLEVGASFVLDICDRAHAKQWTIDIVKKLLEAKLGSQRGESAADKLTPADASTPAVQG